MLVSGFLCVCVWNVDAEKCLMVWCTVQHVHVSVDRLSSMICFCHTYKLPRCLNASSSSCCNGPSLTAQHKLWHGFLAIMECCHPTS
jgi:hypothetical protein